MSTCRYSSMHICICQHCSTQTHSSPEGDRQGVSFTPFQYKQHIKKVKSAIAPKSLAQIPTFASGSHTFSATQGLTSTAQKPYSRSPNLPPQDLGMIIYDILSLSSGGHPTPAFHIPQDLSTIFEHLQLEPVIQNYIFCPQFFFINGPTESVTTYQPHCQHHNDPNYHVTPFTQSLGKFINSFEPQTKNFIHQQFKNWLARFLQWAGIMGMLHQHQQSQIPKGSPKYDIYDVLVWRCFTQTRNINDPHSCPLPGNWPPPFMLAGSMHEESQPGWPALGLSCLFVLISPQVTD
ncbi:hypothetical protein O181_037653 [Austropuccinia psidii MF-1]|uniref:Uncharacterized protein n=1 Tax=Austropuccinia psidii MF-1 TaxID=1389203 RepID=A0A9Q3DBU6_9BASI|nr:hypothetical protein [Austropuccinia psidii MF-1]